MKQDIHPEFHKDCKVTCACGNSFTTGSTLKEMRVELCNKCHPFYTGKQKFVDTARRVEKFHERAGKKAALLESVKTGKTQKHKSTETQKQETETVPTVKKVTKAKTTKKAAKKA